MRRHGPYLVGGFALVSVASALALAANAAQGTARRPIDDYESKVVCLKAVTHLFLKTDLDKFAELVDPSCGIDDMGAGHGKELVVGFRKGFEEFTKSKKITTLADFFSVREVCFFTAGDIGKLRERFAPKRDLWSEKEVPAYIEGALGCYVVAKELQGGKEVDEELYVFVVKKLRGEPKIVFYGNS